MSNPTRKYINMLFEMMEQEVIDPIKVVEMCLSYMTEADVEDMMRDNGILPEEEEE